MTDYIKRDDALSMAISRYIEYYDDETGYIEEAENLVVTVEDIKNLPAADVVEQKHGKWNYYRSITGTDGWEHRWYTCSLCGRLVEQRDNFCPTCGSRMVTDDV